MQRTIEFRGQRADNGEWVYGFHVIDPQGRHRIYYKPFEDATSNTYQFVKPETVQMNNVVEIKTHSDLPPYGKYVLVSGIDKKQYGVRSWHVCEMNDLEDGLDYRDKGEFFWLTESGRKIEDVTHWVELPNIHKAEGGENE